MPFSPKSLLCLKKLSSKYKPYDCGNFFGHASILEKIAIFGQPPSKNPALILALMTKQQRAIGNPRTTAMASSLLHY